MADTTKKAVDNATKEKRVAVTLPRLPGYNANQEALYSLNGKNYIIRRGEEVVIPEGLAEVIRNGEEAERAAIRYVEDLDKAKKEKEKELGL